MVYGFVRQSGGLAKVKRGRYAPLMLWMVSLIVFMVATGEILLRLYAKTMSYQYSVLKSAKEFADLSDEAILEKITYRAGPGLSVYLGLIGTGLMVIAAIYA